MSKPNEPRVEERSPVKWATGWPRTALADRRQLKAWKKNFAYYRDKLVEELRKIGAVEILITFNTGDDARRDPSVTVYFSKPSQEDYSWQTALGIDNPLPTLAEIDEAFRKKALAHHPDRGGDIEVFRSYAVHRDNAKAWVTNAQRSEHEYALPCDRFSEPRWNVNALRLGIAALRRLEDYGLPGMLERSFRGFKTQITHQEQADARTATA